MRKISGRDIYTVSEVNYFAKQTLEQLIFWIEGEVSTVKKNPSWNFYYIDLKDEKAVLPCVTEGHVLENLGGDEILGQKVLAYGNLSLYEPFGKYQFRISYIEKAGEGILQKRLEELVKKLKAEGLFDQKYKKDIPKYPKKVCLVTSEGSDAYNDFIKHTVHKFPAIELYTADVRVQGPRSIPSLINILPRVDKQGFDIIVITRGGGSIEDLAAFNDEQVARAIFNMKTPTIVAIGHEANESLAEWVADRRASTPTDAANIVTAGYNSLLSTLENLRFKLDSKATYYFSVNFQKLDYIHLQLQQLELTFKDLPSRLQLFAQTLKRHEKYLISDAHSHADNLLLTLKKQSQALLQTESQKLNTLERSLLLLSPENTLARGYSITTDQTGKVLRNINDVVVRNIIRVKLTGGKLTGKVLSKQANE